MAFSYSQKTRHLAYALWLQTIAATLLSAMVSVAYPLESTPVETFLSIPKYSKHWLTKRSKYFPSTGKPSTIHLSSCTAASAEFATQYIGERIGSVDMPTSTGFATHLFSPTGLPKPTAVTTIPSTEVSIPSSRKEAVLGVRQVVVMTTSLPAIITLVVDDTSRQPYIFTRSSPTHASTTKQPTTNTASTTANTLPNGGRPPPSGEGYQYVSKDSKCGSKSSVRATCNGSKFGECCSEAGFCGFDDSYCMGGCQSDFGTCGQAGIHPPISSETVTTKASTTSPSNPVKTALTIDQKIGNWTFKGCWTESFNGKALSSKAFVNDSMTLDLCATICESSEMFGAENGHECYCGNTLAADTTLASTQNDCNFPCVGNKLQYCGGNERLQLYTANFSASPLPIASNTNKSAGLGDYNSPQIIGISIAGIVGLLFFVLLGNYRRQVFTRLSNRRNPTPQPPSPSIQFENVNYDTGLSFENINSIKPSRQIPSSKVSVNSSLYRFTNDLHLTDRGLIGGDPFQEQDYQVQDVERDPGHEVPTGYKEVKLVDISKKIMNSALGAAGSGSDSSLVIAVNKNAKRLETEAAKIERAEEEAETIRQERIRHALSARTTVADIGKVLRGGPGWV